MNPACRPSPALRAARPVRSPTGRAGNHPVCGGVSAQSSLLTSPAVRKPAGAFSPRSGLVCGPVQSAAARRTGTSWPGAIRPALDPSAPVAS
jgi:hypothetical protein